jgi:4a-hydroxytetrahydrobiopterin dehydratase
MSEPLDADAIRQSLGGLPDWEYQGDALRKTYTFGDFRGAFAFLVRVAFEAEQRNHHPEITNVYNRVELVLRTHDAGNRVTQKDLDLAQAIETVA